MPEIIIPGPDGRLEARYQHNQTENAPIALMLHPHPLYGGTMNNKVVYTMYHTFYEMGFSVMRMNFRGVGRSQGTYDRGEGELADAAAALDWMQQHNPDAKTCWIAGFSFGAWIAMQLLMRRPEIRRFVAISPPSNMYDFSFLAPCPASGLILQGDQDEVVPEESVARLVDKLKTQRELNIDYRIIDGTNHYFNSRLETMRQHLVDYIDRWYLNPPEEELSPIPLALPGNDEDDYDDPDDTLLDDDIEDEDSDIENNDEKI